MMRYIGTKLPGQAQGTRVVVIEGHPAWPVDNPDTPVPVKTEVGYFEISGELMVRRQV